MLQLIYMRKIDQNDKNVTLKDIAKALNLSVNAVSRALRDTDDISKETKEKVKKKAEDMGYIPNTFASDLKRGISKQVAIIFNDFYNPYFPLFCNKTFNNLQSQGYEGAVIFCKSNYLNLEHIKNYNVNKYCAIITFIEPTAEVAFFFKKRNIPLILVGINPSTTMIDCVYTDDFLGGQLAGKYFVDGPRHKALYVTDSFSETTYRRFSGFSEAIRNNTLNKTLDIIPYSKELNIIEAAYRKIKDENIDFVFCHCDSLAIGLMSYIGRKKYGGKITVVGFDNLHKYNPINLKITSIDYDMDAIIDYTVNALIGKMNGNIDINKQIKKVFSVNISEK